MAVDPLLQEVRGWRRLGIAARHKHFSGVTLSDLVAEEGGFRPGPVDYVNLPVDIDRTMPCVQFGLYLIPGDAGPVAAFVRGPVEHSPQERLSVDVMATDRTVAEGFLARLRELMRIHNVYRGKVLSFDFTPYGSYRLTFHRLPAVARDDIVLPDGVLEAIEAHTMGIARRAEELRPAGRHLKRGLLLYGPPGTGKTLSVMYLARQMPDRTVLLLIGHGLGGLGQAGAMARALQPAMVVLEDVDLVAMDRSLPGLHANPLLFQLLNEMDGLAEDEDVVFVLTTNRVELLEAALAARPGRVDQAVELPLPDPQSRRRLFELYTRGLVADLQGLDEFIDRTDGVSPAFIKELIRRATLDAVERDGSGAMVRDEHMDRALADLLERGGSVLRSLLGARRARHRGAGQRRPPEPIRGERCR